MLNLNTKTMIMVFCLGFGVFTGMNLYSQSGGHSAAPVVSAAPVTDAEVQALRDRMKGVSHSFLENFNVILPWPGQSGKGMGIPLKNAMELLQRDRQRYVLENINRTLDLALKMLATPVEDVEISALQKKIESINPELLKSIRVLVEPENDSVPVEEAMERLKRNRSRSLLENIRMPIDKIYMDQREGRRR